MDQLTAVQSMFPSVVSVIASDCQDCATGMLYKMWLVGYMIYLGWMGLCMSVVIFASMIQLLNFKEWTTTIPDGFMSCQHFANGFL